MINKVQVGLNALPVLTLIYLFIENDVYIIVVDRFISLLISN